MGKRSPIALRWFIGAHRDPHFIASPFVYGYGGLISFGTRLSPLNRTTHARMLDLRHRLAI